MDRNDLGDSRFTFRDGGLEDGHDGYPVEVVVADGLTRGGQSFFFDRPYANAIVQALAPITELFRCKENDTKGEPHGRGDLRLYPSTKKTDWGALAGPKKPEENYPLARIIMDAGGGQAVRMQDTTEPGRRNYHRANLEVVGGSGKTSTRAAFLDGVRWRMVLLQGQAAADRHDASVRDLFRLADALTVAPGATNIIVEHSERETDQ